MIFDVVSDLHVDYWKDTGFEYSWEKSKKNASVIICGDIADGLDVTIQELVKATHVYDNVLYVHGNHEASLYYDHLDQVSTMVSERMRNHSNFFNLCETDFITNGIAFIGACGWWDFEMGSSEENKDVFKQNAMDSFDVSWNKIEGLRKDALVQNIINQANTDFENLKKRLDTHEKNNTRVCIVTHTVPHRRLMHPRRFSKSTPFTMGHSRMHTLTTRKSVVCCVYGHDHHGDMENLVDGQRYVNNARGRPSDANRQCYFPYPLFIHLTEH